VLFWELATLVDIMLLGHWIEMKSVMGASGALRALVELLPADLANRAALWLTFVALGSGLVTLTVWLLSDRGFAFAIERMVTVMVIACPHALGLAVPLVVAVSTALAARSGLLIRDRAAFERGRELQAVVFDKNGTLTQGRFGVTDVVPLADANEDQVLQLAAALESQSEHPIARGIVQKAKELSLPIGHVSDFRNITGQGALARVGKHEIAVVGPGYLDQHGVRFEQEGRLSGLLAQSKTIVYVLRDGMPLGAIALADVARPESRETAVRLKAMGIKCIMLTGDNRTVAKSVADELGLDDYFAEVQPADKVKKIQAVKSRGLTVAMVGDGVNDAPALVESDLGIAVGAGTNVAIESADVVLVRSNPLDVAAILGLSRATYRKMVQNLWRATGYNAVAIPLPGGLTARMGFFLSPAVGAVLTAASTIVVAVNAKLLDGAGSRTTVGRR
jgi:P-type Cu2+ transporter